MQGLHNVQNGIGKAEAPSQNWIELGQPPNGDTHLGVVVVGADSHYIAISLFIRLVMQSGLGNQSSSSTVHTTGGLDRLGHLTRKPQRISITIPYGLYEALVQASDYQGRSLSNLASFLLEEQLFSKGLFSSPGGTQRKF